MSRSIGRTREVSFQKLQKIFKDLTQVQIAVLFGSRARRDTNTKSDYDIAVLMEQGKGGLDNPFYTLYAELPALMNIQECDLDFIDLRTANRILKGSINENYLILKGQKDEISRILREN